MTFIIVVSSTQKTTQSAPGEDGIIRQWLFKEELTHSDTLHEGRQCSDPF